MYFLCTHLVECEWERICFLNFTGLKLKTNIGKTLSDIHHSRILYDPSPRILEIKAKINKWDLIKLKSFCTTKAEKAMAPHSSTLAWKIPWMGEPGGLPSMGSHRVGHNWSNLACMHALEKEMATHSSVLAWRLPWMGEPGGLQPMGSRKRQTRLSD